MIDFLGSTAFLLIMVGLAVVLGLTYIGLSAYRGKRAGVTMPKVNSRRKSATPTKVGNVQALLGFEDIADGLIILPGRRYRIVLEVMGTVNFPLRSSEEQDMVESAFSSLLSTLASMKSPVQMYVQARKLDLLPQITAIDEQKKNLPVAIQAYADAHKEYLSRWMHYAPYVTKRYLVLPFDASPDYSQEQVRRELWRRKEAVEKQIARYLSCRELTTQEIIDLLYTLYNKTKATSQRSADAFSEGFFDLHAKGVRLSEVTAAIPPEGAA